MSYQSSYQSDGYEPAPGHEELVTSRMMRVMSANRWWILIFGLMLCVFLVMALVGTFLFFARLAALGDLGSLWAVAIAGTVLLVCGVTVIFLLVLLIKISAFVNSGSAFDLLDTVRLERVFWLVMAILGLLWILVMSPVMVNWLIDFYEFLFGEVR